MTTYNEASIYWMHLKDHTNFANEGYVGVSQDPEFRFKEHKKLLVEQNHYNQHLNNVAKKYGIENIVLDTIFCGDEKYCYEIESLLRPTKNVGWNIAPGGHRGPGKQTSQATLLKIERKEAHKKIKEEKRLSMNLGMRPICPACNQRPRAVAYHREDKIYYRSKCGICSKKGRKIKPAKPRWELAGYKKKAVCDKCGFRSVYSAQLLVYHVDSNLNNCKTPNLKTICLNCVVEVKKSDLLWKPGDLSLDL